MCSSWLITFWIQSLQDLYAEFLQSCLSCQSHATCRIPSQSLQGLNVEFPANSVAFYMLSSTWTFCMCCLTETACRKVRPHRSQAKLSRSLYGRWLFMCSLWRWLSPNPFPQNSHLEWSIFSHQVFTITLKLGYCRGIIHQRNFQGHPALTKSHPLKDGTHWRSYVAHEVRLLTG